MFVVKTPRARLALFATAALAAVPGVLPQGGFLIGDRQPGSAVVAAVDGLDLLVATTATSHSMHVALRGVPLDSLALAAVIGLASLIGVRRHHQVRVLHFRFGDVGDAWRALLLGAPPVLL